MSISAPFQITEQDVQYSSTLERRDIGKWALIINGCFQIYPSESAAIISKHNAEHDFSAEASARWR